MKNFIVRGLGFFNGSYDLFVMNVVNVVLTELYGSDVYDTHMKSAVSAAALIGAAVGQLFFGVLGDIYGRKANMVATCVLLIVGEVLCACAYGGSPRSTLWFLVISRGLLGIGIGGEYPLAATTMVEDASSVSQRNTRVALTFSLQGVGSLTAAVLGNLLIRLLANDSKGTNDPVKLEIIWRVLFGIGVLPATIVCYSRITAEETIAYKAVQERRKIEAQRNGGRVKRVSIWFIIKNYGWGLLGTAGTWFLFDIVFYAQNMFSASTLSVIGVDNLSLQVVTTQNMFVALMALPGYYAAVFFINSIGRKSIQMQGFAFMTVIFLCLATLWHDLTKDPIAFILLYGLALFFSNFGPNMSTFVMPTEMFPTPIRSSCHGFSAACGKAGAAIGSFGFGIWSTNPHFGYSGAFYVFAGICLISIPLTWFCMFDSEQSIDDMDEEFFELLHEADFFADVNFDVMSMKGPSDLTPPAAGGYKSTATPYLVPS